MANSTNIAAPFVAANQAQKEVTVNTAIATIDAILNRGAIDRALDTPPGSPAAGDLYIVGSSPTGDWSANAGDIAYYQTTWKFISPNEGMTLWVNDEDLSYTWDGSDWVVNGVGSLDDLSDVAITSATTNDILQFNGTNFVNQQKLDSLSQVGINTASDATNKLSVNSEAVLFNNEGDDVRIKANKDSSGDTASHLFQTGFSGRAEFGLIGDDHYQLKVSDDGSNWYQAYVVTNSTGDIDFKQDVNITGTISGVDIDDLDNTTISSPANGEILQYNGSTWVNAAVSGASSTLAALTDTDISSPADNDFLVYDGSDWVNEVPATARASMGLGTIATQAATSVNIDGGAIDGTAIGASSASSGAFTTINASGAVTLNDNTLTRPELKDYAETKTSPSSSSGTLTLDLENGNVFEVTLTENVSTTNFSNPPASGKGGSFTLILKQDGTGGRTIAWPAAVDWAGGSSPTLTTTASAVDILTFCTVDAGTRWYGFLAGANMS